MTDRPMDRWMDGQSGLQSRIARNLKFGFNLNLSALK